MLVMHALLLFESVLFMWL